ncbi:MAG TPA: serine hydrolase [Vicinamibacterales bacterium]|nr:serine hydrolase [Vicinamibacterales bacterium]
MTRRVSRLILVVLPLAIAAAARPAEPPGPPGALQAAVEGAARRLDGTIGVYAKHLRTGEEIAVDADRRFPTASVIKVAVMVEAFHQLAQGRLARDDRVRLDEAAKVGGTGVLRELDDGLEPTIGDLIRLMIVVSDNTATNLLLERVGTRHVNARMEAYGLRETKIFRPTFRDGRPDVLPELEREFGLGMSTPREMARLMELIATGRAVSEAASREMLAILDRQQDRQMIARRLPLGRGVSVGNKTGADEEKRPGPDGVRRHLRADAAIVRAGDVRYVVAVFARQVADTSWGPDNAALVAGGEIGRLIFDAWVPARARPHAAAGQRRQPSR